MLLENQALVEPWGSRHCTLLNAAGLDQALFERARDVTRNFRPRCLTSSRSFRLGLVSLRHGVLSAPRSGTKMSELRDLEANWHACQTRLDEADMQTTVLLSLFSGSQLSLT